MVRRLTSFALNQPLFVLLLTGLFLVGGVVAFRNLPIEAFPDVTDIQVTVITLYPGYAAEEVEKDTNIPMPMQAIWSGTNQGQCASVIVQQLIR